MMKTLIVNADDYGLTSAVSKGIREAYLKGILTSTTVMVTGLTVENDIPLLIKECPEIGIGIHLTLTNLRPVSAPALIESLLNPQGRFYPLNELISCAGEIDEEELYLEWKAQIERLLSLGVKPGHLDSHHNACLICEQSVNVMVRLAEKFSLSVRTPVSPNGNNSLESYAIERLNKYRIGYPKTFNMNFTGQKGSQSALSEILSRLAPGITEICSHPGYIDDELRNISSLIEARLTELKTLCSAETAELVAVNNIQLATFGEAFKTNGF